MVLPVDVVLPVLVVLVVVLVLSQALTLFIVIRRNRSYSKLVEATSLLIDDIDQARFERLLSPVSMNELEAELFGTPSDENADEMVRLDSSDALGADEASHAELLSSALTAHATRSALVTDEFALPAASEVAATPDLPAPPEVAPTSPATAVEPVVAEEPVAAVPFEQPAAVSKRTHRVPPAIVSKQPVAPADFDPDAEYGSSEVTENFVHRNGFDPSRFGPAEIVVVPDTTSPRFAPVPPVAQPVHVTVQPTVAPAVQQTAPVGAQHWTVPQAPPAGVYQAPPATVPPVTAAPPATAAPQRPASHLPPPPQFQQPAAPQYQQPAPQFHAGVQHGTAPLRQQAPPPAAPPAVPVSLPPAPVTGQQPTAARPVTPSRTAPRRDSVHTDGFTSIEEMAVSAVIDGGRPVPQVAQTLRVSTALVAYWVSKSGRTRAR